MTLDMRINATMALRKISELMDCSFVLNRDPKAAPHGKCQCWVEKDGDFTLVASGRTWEHVINSIFKAKTK